MVEKKKSLDKKFLPTIIAIIVLLVLVVLVVPLKKPSPSVQTGYERKQLFDFKPSEVTQIEILSTKNREINMVLEKIDEKTWHVNGQLAYTPDIQDILTVLSTVGLIGEIKDYNNLEEFGLKPPHKDLKMTLKNGKSYRVYIGDTTPTSSNRYAMLEKDNTVYIADKYLYNALSATPQSLINRDIFKIEPSEVEELVIEKGNNIIRFKKDGDHWYLIQQDDQKLFADQSNVKSILVSLFGNAADVYIDEKVKDLKNYKLDDPLVSLRARTSDGKDVKVLYSDAIPSTKLFYALNTLDNKVYVVNKTKIDRITMPEMDFRNKNLVTVPMSDLDKVIVYKNDKEYTFKKDRRNLWVSKETGLEDIVTNQYILDLSARYADIISDLKYHDTKEDFGFDNPELKIELYRKGSGTPDTIKTGKASKEGYYYVSVNKDPYLYLIYEDTFRFLKNMGKKDPPRNT
jgi:hypothetical protein